MPYRANHILCILEDGKEERNLSIVGKKSQRHRADTMGIRRSQSLPTPQSPIHPFHSTHPEVPSHSASQSPRSFLHQKTQKKKNHSSHLRSSLICHCIHTQHPRLNFRHHILMTCHQGIRVQTVFMSLSFDNCRCLVCIIFFLSPDIIDRCLDGIFCQH